jgi:hypothetical protein
VLAATVLYCSLLAIKTLYRLRGLSREDAGCAKRALRDLSNRWTNAGQVIHAAFYLFAGALFLGLQTIGLFSVDGTISVERLFLDGIVLQSAFATNCFVLLLVAHIFQWAGSAAVGRLSLRFDHDGPAA